MTRTHLPWLLVGCAAAAGCGLRVPGDQERAERVRKAKAEMFAQYGGSGDAPCRSELSEGEEPWFDMQLHRDVPSTASSDLHVFSHTAGLGMDARSRLAERLESRQRELLACVGAAAHDGEWSVALHLWPDPIVWRERGDLAAEELGCLAATIESALAGLPVEGPLTVRVGAESVASSKSGSLARSAIQKVIGAHIEEVRECYLRALKGWRDIQGRVAVRFMIGPDGAVPIAYVVHSDTANGPLDCCIAAAMKTWAFPPPAGGGRVFVTYPYVLKLGF